MSAHIKKLWTVTPDYVQPYVQTGIEWFEENVKEVFLCEERLVDEDLGFTGQLDLFCELYDDGTALVDWKTSVAKYDYWGLQTAGYGYLLYKKFGEYPKNRLTVRLRSDTMKLCLTNYWEDPENYKDFLGRAATYKIF